MNKIRLLIVDQNEIFTEGLTNLIKREPTFEIVNVCQIGLEAVEHAKKYQPDVVVIDADITKHSDLNIIRTMR